MTYDNIKSYKKPGFHPLFRRYIFRIINSTKCYILETNLTIAQYLFSIRANLKPRIILGQLINSKIVAKNPFCTL